MHFYRGKCTSTWSYENRVSKHVIFLDFPCLIACLLCCLLMSFFLALFVFRDLCRSGCRQNDYLTPAPPFPLPIFLPFFVATHNSVFNTSDSYLKSVYAYDITTWVNDLIDAHIEWSTFFSSFSPMLAAKMGPLSSKTYSLTTLREKKRRIVGKWPSLSVTD